MRIAEAADACLTPVLDGRPTQADVGQAFRMVSNVAVLPGDDRPWLQAYNRRGQWTIDAEGRYVPFPGPDAGGFGLTFVNEATTGRNIAAHDGALLVADRTRGFTPLAKVSDDHDWPALLRAERLDLTLVMTRDAVLRLRGDVVEPWAERSQVGGAGHVQAFDLPALRAILFATSDGALKVRQDDGRWSTVGSLLHDGHRDYVEKVRGGETGATALLQMRSLQGPSDRLLALTRMGQDGPFRLVEAGRVDHSRDHSGPQVLYASGADEVLKFEQPDPGAEPRWSRLTREGYRPIPGGLAPSRDGDFPRLFPTDLPRRRAVAFETDRGLALYRDGTMRLIPNPTPEGLGRLPKVVDLPTIDRTLVLATRGLFELTADDRLVRVEAPFSTGGLPRPEIFEDTRRGQAVIHAPEGLFTLDRKGVFRRVPGPAPREMSYDEYVVTLAVSGDHLLKLDNALWLLVSPASPRWAACAKPAGVR